MTINAMFINAEYFRIGTMSLASVVSIQTVALICIPSSKTFKGWHLTVLRQPKEENQSVHLSAYLCV